MKTSGGADFPCALTILFAKLNHASATVRSTYANVANRKAIKISVASRTTISTALSVPLFGGPVGTSGLVVALWPPSTAMHSDPTPSALLSQLKVDPHGMLVSHLFSKKTNGRKRQIAAKTAQSSAGKTLTALNRASHSRSASSRKPTLRKPT